MKAESYLMSNLLFEHSLNRNSILSMKSNLHFVIMLKFYMDKYRPTKIPFSLIWMSYWNTLEMKWTLIYFNSRPDHFWQHTRRSRQIAYRSTRNQEMAKSCCWLVENDCGLFVEEVETQMEGTKSCKTFKEYLAF